MSSWIKCDEDDCDQRITANAVDDTLTDQAVFATLAVTAKALGWQPGEPYTAAGTIDRCPEHAA